MDNNNSFWIFV